MKMDYRRTILENFEKRRMRLVNVTSNNNARNLYPTRKWYIKQELFIRIAVNIVAPATNHFVQKSKFQRFIVFSKAYCKDFSENWKMKNNLSWEKQMVQITYQVSDPIP